MGSGRSDRKTIHGSPQLDEILTSLCAVRSEKPSNNEQRPAEDDPACQRRDRPAGLTRCGRRLVYCERSDVIGSIRIARRAGTRLAIATTSMSMPTTLPNTNGSRGVTPYSTDDTTPIVATDSTRPIASP